MIGKNFYDVIVIGGGPAGLTAALYLARARFRVVVLEKEKFGGQITITSEVVNYPGVEKGSGDKIASAMRRQAENFGAEFMLAEATAVDFSGAEKIVSTSRGELHSHGIIIATGSHPRSIGFEGEDTFKGRGVAYCATCDGEFFSGMDVFVVGGGFAAAEESIFLTKYAKHVTVLVREDDFTCAKATADPVKNHEKISIHYNTVVLAAKGEEQLNRLECENIATGEKWAYDSPDGESFGLFVFAGYQPESGLFKSQIALDKQGYITTDNNRKTSCDGVYAAGDICQKNLRQLVTATADGATAATELERYVTEQQVATGKVPQVEQPITTQKEPEHIGTTDTDGFFTADVRAQLAGVFAKMEQPVILQATLDNRPVSNELEEFLKELVSIGDKVSLVTKISENKNDMAPMVQILRQTGGDTGIAFHGVPGGHEFNAFVLALYNAAGPGQALDPTLEKRIQAIQQPVDIKIFVSLSCTLCPDTVMAAQRIAAATPFVTAHAYDLNHFPALREQHNIMSVPCVVVNNNTLSFGKKSVEQILDLL